MVRCVGFSFFDKRGDGMKRQFRAIVFDCGNVTNLYRFSKVCYGFAKHAWFRDHETFFRVRPHEIMAVIYDDEKTSLLRKLERGIDSPHGIGAQSFRDIVSLRLCMTIRNKEFDRIWNSMFTEVDPGMLAWLRALRANGYPLIMATNNNEIHMKFLRETYPEIFEQFERVIASQDIGLVKSDGKKFYDHVLAAARTLVKDIEYSDMIYFDDILRYVKTWQRCGGKAVWFHETVQAQFEATKFGLTW